MCYPPYEKDLWGSRGDVFEALCLAGCALAFVVAAAVAIVLWR
jgi:hypothetical protein